MFLSGTAGSLFYDQAMAVAIALFASLGVSVLVIPVYYYCFYKSHKTDKTYKLDKDKWLMGAYNRIHAHIFRWPKTYICLGFLCVPLTALLFVHLDKERMPFIAPDDTLVHIDWNSGISAEENDRRISALLSFIDRDVAHSTVMVSTQQFLLPHTKDLTTSEAIIYIKCADAPTMEARDARSGGDRGP